MSAPLSPVARKGDRVSHGATANTHSSNALVAAMLGQSLTVRGAGGALLAQIGAAASCAVHRAVLSITELIPQIVSGVIEVASPTVFVAPGLGAAVAAAPPVICAAHYAMPIAPGATNILVQGLALARSGGVTTCGAILCDGALTVLAGGLASAGAGSGTRGGSPIADAIAYAENIAGQISATVASVERGAALIEHTVEATVAEVKGTVSGALSALTGALASFTGGGARAAVLGVLTGQTLASP